MKNSLLIPFSVSLVTELRVLGWRDYGICPLSLEKSLS